MSATSRDRIQQKLSGDVRTLLAHPAVAHGPLEAFYTAVRAQGPHNVFKMFDALRPDDERVAVGYCMAGNGADADSHIFSGVCTARVASADEPHRVLAAVAGNAAPVAYDVAALADHNGCAHAQVALTRPDESSAMLLFGAAPGSPAKEIPERGWLTFELPGNKQAVHGEVRNAHVAFRYDLGADSAMRMTCADGCLMHTSQRELGTPAEIAAAIEGQQPRLLGTLEAVRTDTGSFELRRVALSAHYGGNTNSSALLLPEESAQHGDARLCAALRASLSDGVMPREAAQELTAGINALQGDHAYGEQIGVSICVDGKQAFCSARANPINVFAPSVAQHYLSMAVLSACRGRCGDSRIGMQQLLHDAHFVHRLLKGYQPTHELALALRALYGRFDSALCGPTLLQLLTNTAGLPVAAQLPLEFAHLHLTRLLTAKYSGSLQELAESLAMCSIECVPGSTVAYSPLAWAITAAVVVALYERPCASVFSLFTKHGGFACDGAGVWPRPCDFKTTSDGLAAMLDGLWTQRDALALLHPHYAVDAGEGLSMCYGGWTCQEAGALGRCYTKQNCHGGFLAAVLPHLRTTITVHSERGAHTTPFLCAAARIKDFAVRCIAKLAGCDGAACCPSRCAPLCPPPPCRMRHLGKLARALRVLTCKRKKCHDSRRCTNHACYTADHCDRGAAAQLVALAGDPYGLHATYSSSSHAAIDVQRDLLDFAAHHNIVLTPMLPSRSFGHAMRVVRLADAGVAAPIEGIEHAIVTGHASTLAAWDPKARATSNTAPLSAHDGVGYVLPCHEDGTLRLLAEGSCVAGSLPVISTVSSVSQKDGSVCSVGLSINGNMMYDTGTVLAYHDEATRLLAAAQDRGAFAAAGTGQHNTVTHGTMRAAAHERDDHHAYDYVTMRNATPFLKQRHDDEPQQQQQQQQQQQTGLVLSLGPRRGYYSSYVPYGTPYATWYGPWWADGRPRRRRYWRRRAWGPSLQLVGAGAEPEHVHQEHTARRTHDYAMLAHRAAEQHA